METKNSNCGTSAIIHLSIFYMSSLQFPSGVLSKNTLFRERSATAPQEFRTKAFFKKDITGQRVTWSENKFLLEKFTAIIRYSKSRTDLSGRSRKVAGNRSNLKQRKASQTQRGKANVSDGNKVK